MARAQGASPARGIVVQRLRAHVHVAAGYENGNVLIVATDSGTLLVDAQSAARVAALDSALTRLRVPRVRAVVNTHYHGDHTEGNASFRALGARVYAQAAVRVQAAKDTIIPEWDNWHRTPLASAALPTHDVRDSLALSLGGERVVLLHAPRAHTDGDLMVWLPRANVLHIGDILEVGAPPFIDWWAGGTLNGMVAAIDRMLPLVNDSTAIVPGHGAVSTRSDLRRYREMLVTVDQRVRAAVARGDSAAVARGDSAAVARGDSAAVVLAARPAREWETSLGGERRAGHFVRLVLYGAMRDRARVPASDQPRVPASDQPR
jgi:glyoxylase-like metal-dependent hydrolase (beta-lactamase superfamily II)